VLAEKEGPTRARNTNRKVFGTNPFSERENNGPRYERLSAAARQFMIMRRRQFHATRRGVSQAGRKKLRPT